MKTDTLWNEFDALELSTVVGDGETDAGNRANVWPIFSMAEVDETDHFESHTIYGHLTGGGVKALADCYEIETARAIAAALAKATGLPVNDLLVEWDADAIGVDEDEDEADGPNVITREAFDATFQPRLSPTGEPTWSHKQTLGEPLAHVWTIVSSDDGSRSYASPGYHIVNREGYVVTTQPWTDKTLDARWD